MQPVEPEPFLALDLASTVVDAGDGATRDLLDSPRELERWLFDHGIEGGALALRLGDFRELREAIRAAVDATIEGRPVPPDGVEALNAASAVAPVVRRLVLDPGPPSAVDAETAGAATIVLARIARSAIDTLGGPDRDRLRRCPAPRCGRPFLATRQRQRWCSTACGNRVRVARHAERRRSGRSDGPA
jgi:predicted RNA-binding Zn ribbon-like protein